MFYPTPPTVEPQKPNPKTMHLAEMAAELIEGHLHHDDAAIRIQAANAVFQNIYAFDGLFQMQRDEMVKVTEDDVVGQASVNVSDRATEEGFGTITVTIALPLLRRLRRKARRGGVSVEQYVSIWLTQEGFYDLSHGPDED